ncbi:FmdB family zinc ribbon protein [Halorussus amylolyticus]|uniref:hypothetical protein n=1 Tax=Halorussus amylolyticus TaxID=1126242 RepID=UPI00192FB4F0|nr:hypothetical protein [Halorussus amylolyticus]
MGLTIKLARAVRAAGKTGRRDAYECQHCGARFDLDRQTCPDCGGCTIDRTEWSGQPN